jgi:hypothetical protein
MDGKVMRLGAQRSRVREFVVGGFQSELRGGAVFKNSGTRALVGEEVIQDFDNERYGEWVFFFGGALWVEWLLS